VATSAVRAPLRSISALVASVVPSTKRATSDAGSLAWPRISVMPSITPCSGAPGVVSTLAVQRAPPACSTTSVNEPPMSIASTGPGSLSLIRA
jgi:hypothetical protein